MKNKVIIFWFRRDVRLHDNHGLYHALAQGTPVLAVFIFDKEQLDLLTTETDIRMSFLYKRIVGLKSEIEKSGSSLRVMYSNPQTAFKHLLKEFDVTDVYANKEYEPFTRTRDDSVGSQLGIKGVQFHLFKDHVLLEEQELLNDNEKPYTLFTPYSRKWKKLMEPDSINSYSSGNYLHNFFKTLPFYMPSIEELGFKNIDYNYPSDEISEIKIRNYSQTRDFPAIEGTTRLGIHLRTGTISIRELAVKAFMWSAVFLNELIWRDFFISILWHFPEVATRSFKPRFDDIRWRNNEEEFERWYTGNTGYAMVDAGIRELNATGFMHNRTRMITAGFLTKHLLIDWRWGEAWFADKLLDYDMALNNGNWQWAAGTGCDGAPWFRIFNPEIQQKKFDPDKIYIKKWIPEIGSSQYPAPVVDHKLARQRALLAYKEGI